MHGVLFFTLFHNIAKVVRPTGVYLLDLFSSGIEFYALLSHYLCFISVSYLNLCSKR